MYGITQRCGSVSGAGRRLGVVSLRGVRTRPTIRTADTVNVSAWQLGAQDRRTPTPAGLDEARMSASAYDRSVIFLADNNTQQTYANAAQRDGHRTALVMMRGDRPASGRTRGN
jgi:D-alanyl-D-alanine carboxypeptidase